MAAFPRLRAVDDAEAIPRLMDDPRYAGPAALLAAFVQRQSRLDAERLRAVYEFHFANRPAGQRETENDRAMRARWAGLRETLAASSPPPAKDVQPSTSPAIAAAVLLLSGQPAAPTPDHAARLREFDRQISIISAAIAEQTEVVDAIKSQLSFEACKRLVPRWNAQQLAMYRRASAVCAGRVGRRIGWRTDRRRIHRARRCADTDGCALAGRLGRQEDHNSEIAQWRKHLEVWGVLP